MSLSNIKVNNSTVTEVDDEPISRSENLVKSGGIFNSLLNIRQTIGLLTFQLRDFSNNGWVASTNRGEANLVVADIDNYKSFVVTPKDDYEIAAIHFNNIDGTGTSVLLVYQSEPIDFKSLNSDRTYYGVMIRKSDQSTISQSELSDLVSISKQTKDLNASEIAYGGLEQTNVQAAIDDLYNTIGGNPESLLVFKHNDFGNTSFVDATNRALTIVNKEQLSDYLEYRVAPKNGYLLALLRWTNNPITDYSTPNIYPATGFGDSLIDIIQNISSYNYFGIIVKKSNNSDIATSEFGNLVSIDATKNNSVLADNVVFTPNEVLESTDVQSAINELCDKVFPTETLVFQLRDFGDTVWNDSTTRAEANLEVAHVNGFESYVVTPKEGYEIAAIHFNSLDLSTGTSVLLVYQLEPIDFKSLNSDRTYYGVMIRKADNSVINQSELTSLVTISAEKEDSNSADVVFMSVSGNDSNEGSYDSPVLTIGRALSISDNVVIKEGQYDNFALSLATISNRNISIKADTGKQVILMNRRIYATTGNTGSLVSGKTNVYQIASSVAPSGWLYQHLVNDVNTVVAKAYSHPAQRGKEYRCDSTILRNAADSYSTLSDALNFIESEAASNRYYFFYDSDNQMLYFSSPQTPSDEHPICGSKGACITGNNDRNKIQLTGLNFYYGTVDFKNVEDSEVADCSSKYTFGWGAFHWTDCKNLKYIRCEAAGNCYGTYGDGFNGDSTIMTVDPYTSAVHLIDCWAHDNHDDGYSDHNGCNCNILGGLYEYNRKGGVTPAAGSHCTVLGTISRNNINGFYYVVGNADQGIAGNVVFNDCLAYNNEHSGFRCEGTDNYTECVNCISHDNAEYGYKGVIKARNCYAANNSTAEKDANVTVIQVSALS